MGGKKRNWMECGIMCFFEEASALIFCSKMMRYGLGMRVCLCACQHILMCYFCANNQYHMIFRQCSNAQLDPCLLVSLTAIFSLSSSVFFSCPSSSFLNILFQSNLLFMSLRDVEFFDQPAVRATWVLSISRATTGAEGATAPGASLLRRGHYWATIELHFGLSATADVCPWHWEKLHRRLAECRQTDWPSYSVNDVFFKLS